jgi:hypothetical protein
MRRRPRHFAKGTEVKPRRAAARRCRMTRANLLEDFKEFTMNTAYWQVFFGRMRRRMMLITIVLSLLAIGQMKGAEVVATVTGIVRGGSGDMLHIFGKNRDMTGQPFTLVFTFDDTKGKPIKITQCQGTASGVEGDGEDSPGKAVLTIGDKSYTFGTTKNRHSGTWREITTDCARSHIVFQVNDNHNNNIELNIRPAAGARSFTQDTDWRHPLSFNLDNYDNMSGFSIGFNAAMADGGMFDVKSIEISGPKKASPAWWPFR